MNHRIHITQHSGNHRIMFSGRHLRKLNNYLQS